MAYYLKRLTLYCWNVSITVVPTINGCFLENQQPLVFDWRPLPSYEIRLARMHEILYFHVVAGTGSDNISTL